jgi:hypothetical protein
MLFYFESHSANDSTGWKYFHPVASSTLLPVWTDAVTTTTTAAACSSTSVGSIKVARIATGWAAACITIVTRVVIGADYVIWVSNGRPL